MLSLTKRDGVFGPAWLAAHVERRVSKSQINETDVCRTAEAILFTTVPLSLRVSAYLLLGVVRIYARKVNYLLTLCNETVVKITKSSVVEPVATRQAIEAPAVLDLLDTFPEEEEEEEANSRADLHVALPEQITLQQSHDHGRCSFFFELDERFPNGSLDAFFEAEPGCTAAAESNRCQLRLIVETHAEAASCDAFEPRTPPRLRSCEQVVAAKVLFESPLEEGCVQTKETDSYIITNLEQERGQAPDEANQSIWLDKGENATTVKSGTEKESENFAPRTPRKRQLENIASSRKKRKRLVFDTPTVLSSDVLRNQLAHVGDLVRTPKRAPCTYRQIFSAQLAACCKQDLFATLSVAAFCGNFDSRALTVQSFSEDEKQPDSLQPVTATPVAEEAELEDETEKNEFQDGNPASEELENPPPVTGSDQLLKTPPRDCLDIDCPAEDEPISTFSLQEYDAELLDEGGWPSRTRAVALHLKEAFQKDPGATSLNLEQVATSMSRRQAACLFFDILVLKTRDYIRVEQAAPFGNIMVLPGANLDDL